MIINGWKDNLNLPYLFFHSYNQPVILSIISQIYYATFWFSWLPKIVCVTQPECIRTIETKTNRHISISSILFAIRALAPPLYKWMFVHLVTVHMIDRCLFNVKYIEPTIWASPSNYRPFGLKLEGNLLIIMKTVDGLADSTIRNSCSI